MTITVSCAECAKKVGYPVVSSFEDRAGAVKYRRRHQAIHGHTPDIQEDQC